MLVEPPQAGRPTPRSPASRWARAERVRPHGGLDPEVRAVAMWTSMRGEPFAVASLLARAGLSNVIAFFFADQVVLCDFGMIGGPQARSRHDVDIAVWCEAMRAKAKRVVVVLDADISSVRVRLRMMQHELWVMHQTGDIDHAGYRGVRRAAPAVLRYALLQRDEAEPAAHLLAERFGPRFELATTRAYAFVHRVSPLLTR